MPRSRENYTQKGKHAAGFPLSTTKNIELCQTEYYDYEIIRENRGKKTTIYRGKYRNAIFDNSIREGETYIYTVTPTYQEHRGKEVTLPAVTVPVNESIPDKWWV